MVIASRQSARSADDDVKKQQENETPDRVRSNDLDQYREMSPDANSAVMKSARSK